MNCFIVFGVESKNPPSIPTLALAWLVSRITGSKVIIDWHNLGYSILALKFGEKHLFVRIYRWYVLLVILYVRRLSTALQGSNKHLGILHMHTFL